MLRPRWYCNLSEPERACLAYLVNALPGTLFVGVPVEEFEAFWLGVTQSQEARRAAFLVIYCLQIVTITPPDDPPYEAVAPTYLPFWTEAFFWTPGVNDACSEGEFWVNYG